MVAAHAYDVRAAGAAGMRSVYVRRGTEDGELVRGEGVTVRDSVKARSEGGDVDAVVEGLAGLGEVLRAV